MTRSKVLNTVAIYKLEIVNTYNKLIFRLEMNRRAIEQAIVFTLQMGNGKWEMGNGHFFRDANSHFEKDRAGLAQKAPVFFF